MRNENLTPETVPPHLADFAPATTPENTIHAPGTLVDKYGRHITYLRLSRNFGEHNAVMAGLSHAAGDYCVIMDDLDNATAIEVMKTFQQSPSSRSVVPMAIHTGSPSAIPGLMFSVVKPLAEEAAVRTLRAAHGQMVQELRRYIRYPLTVPVTLTSERGQELRAVCRNLSLRGVGIQVPARLTVGVSVQTQLALEAGVTLAGVGQVAWCDISGRAGISCRGATQRDSGRRLQDPRDLPPLHEQ